MKYVQLGVALLIAGLAPIRYFNTGVGTRDEDVRFDLWPSTKIDIQDMGRLVSGSSGSPPILGGARAVGGPTCPWAP